MSVAGDSEESNWSARRVTGADIVDGHDAGGTDGYDVVGEESFPDYTGLGIAYSNRADYPTARRE